MIPIHMCSDYRYLLKILFPSNFYMHFFRIKHKFPSMKNGFFSYSIRLKTVFHIFNDLELRRLFVSLF